jgi:hypothetical protein
VSRWRRHALDAFPERREWIARVADLDEVLRLLSADVVAATTAGWHPVDRIVSRACDFGAWCLLPEQDASVRQAAAEFYTRLMQVPEARDASIERLPLEAVRGLWPAFRARLPIETLRSLRVTLVEHYGRDADSLPGAAI